MCFSPTADEASTSSKVWPGQLPEQLEAVWEGFGKGSANNIQLTRLALSSLFDSAICIWKLFPYL